MKSAQISTGRHIKRACDTALASTLARMLIG
jgi:hypothetical protein